MFDTVKLRSPFEQQRVHAIRDLARTGGAKAADAVIPLLEDKSSKVRIAACDALGTIGDLRAVDHLESRVAHDTADVKVAAVSALGNLRCHASAKVLVRALASEVGDAASQALSQLGPLAVPLCVDAMQGPHWARRRNAAWVLSKAQWQAANDIERAHFLVLNGRIDEALKLGQIAIPPLALLCEDPQRTDDAVLGLLALGDKRGEEAIERALDAINKATAAQDAPLTRTKNRWSEQGIDAWLNFYRRLQEVRTEPAGRLRAIIVQAFITIGDCHRRKYDTTRWECSHEELKRIRLRARAALDDVLSGLRDPRDDDVPVLASLLDNDPNYQSVHNSGPYKGSRTEALSKLLKLGPASVPALADELSRCGKNSPENLQIITRLTQLSGPGTVAVLKDFVSRPESDKGLPQALEALERVDKAIAKEALLLHLGSIRGRGDAGDRYLIEAAVRYPGSDVIDALTGIVRGTEIDLRVVATRSLLQLGESDGVIFVIENCKGNKDRALLDNTTHKIALKALLEMLTEYGRCIAEPLNQGIVSLVQWLEGPAEKYYYPGEGQRSRFRRKRDVDELVAGLCAIVRDHSETLETSVLKSLANLDPKVWEKVGDEDHYYFDPTKCDCSLLHGLAQRVLDSRRADAAT